MELGHALLLVDAVKGKETGEEFVAKVESIWEG